MASRRRWRALLIVACLAFAGIAVAQPLQGRAARRAPAATVAWARAVARARAQLAAGSPVGTLVGTRMLRITGQSFTPHAAVVVTQCSTSALRAALTALPAPWMTATSTSSP